MTELNTSEKILLHAEAMFRESCKEEMKVLKKVDEKKYTEYFINRYTDLHNNYPALFNLLILDGSKFDMTKLKQMLRMKDKVDRQEVSTQAASEQIGQQYFNEFCRPLVPPPPST